MEAGGSGVSGPAAVRLVAWAREWDNAFVMHPIHRGEEQPAWGKKERSVVIRKEKSCSPCITVNISIVFLQWRRHLRGKTLRGGELIPWKGWVFTLSKRTESLKPPHTCDSHSTRRWTESLFIVYIWCAETVLKITQNTLSQGNT